MAKPLDQLLQKEVTRKEFLALSGFAVASVFGLGTIVKLLTGHESSSPLHKVAAGYGKSAYGGSKEGR